MTDLEARLAREEFDARTERLARYHSPELPCPAGPQPQLCRAAKVPLLLGRHGLPFPPPSMKRSDSTSGPSHGHGTGENASRPIVRRSEGQYVRHHQWDVVRIRQIPPGGRLIGLCPTPCALAYSSYARTDNQPRHCLLIHYNFARSSTHERHSVF
jgi:hypothetical protein